MASLFSNIQELQQHLGGAINASVEMEHIAPYIDNAYLNHLQLWLGDTIWEAVVAAHVGGSPSPDQAALIKKVQACLAPLTYIEYAAFADIQFSGSGRYRTETEELKTPYKYQVAEADRRMLNMGYQALERLVLFLEAKVDTYTDWPDAPGYALHHSALLNTALLFQQNNGQRTARHEFEMLLPLVGKVEEFVLVPLFTEALYLQLKENRKAGTLTALEKTLIGHSQRCTAEFTLEEALQRHIVQLKDGRVVQTETLEPQGYRKEGTAPASALRLPLQRYELMANRHYVAMNRFLDANLDAPEFAAYKAKVDAEAAAAEEEETTDFDCLRSGHIRLPAGPRSKGVERL